MRADSQQRAAILEAAMHIFAYEGLNGASIRLVGKKAGVNSALIYYYFENKDTLFREAIRTCVDDVLRDLEQHRHPFNDAADRLGYLVGAVFSYYQAHPERMRLMEVATSLHAELFASIIGVIFREKMAIPLQILEEGIALGQIRPMNPIQIWWSILGMCIFSLHMMDVFSHLRKENINLPIPDIETRRKAIVDLLINGLTAK